jgi:hypothetical protein
MSQIAKTIFRKIVATRLLKIWQRFRTPPNSFIFLEHLEETGQW